MLLLFLTLITPISLKRSFWSITTAFSLLFNPFSFREE